jgi:murein L,D-transpeptidase YafK
VYRIVFAFKRLGLSGSARVARVAATLMSALAVGFVLSPAFALNVELDDVAPDRIERQRAFARGILPGHAYDPDTFEDRLTAQGLVEGAPILIRIFKEESQLELWMHKGDAFVLQGTYPICHWTGTLGPKMREGDKQSPEGFYTIGAPQIRHRGRWQRAFNLGYPNLHDKALRRTGSYILVHGGCSSTGCYAMTEPAQHEIHRLASAALSGGQARFQVHIFPFRMTEANLAKHAESPWAGFWRDLKAGYDAFEQTRLPPHLNLCGQRYVVTAAGPRERTDGPLTRIDERKAAAAGLDPSICRIEPLRLPSLAAAVPDREPAGAAAETESGVVQAPRSVFRIERPTLTPLNTSSASRHVATIAAIRARAVKKRRAHRAELDDVSRRNRLSVLSP